MTLCRDPRDVWKARWYNLHVAVKVLKEGSEHSDAITTKFLDEIRLTWCVTPLACIDIASRAVTALRARSECDRVDN